MPGCVVWFNRTARPPPPVILPAAPGASRWLGGALRQASPFGLALPRMLGAVVLDSSVWRSVYFFRTSPFFPSEYPAGIFLVASSFTSASFQPRSM